MTGSLQFAFLAALALATAGCGGIEGVGVPGGLNARRVELAQPIVDERTLQYDIQYAGNEVLPSLPEQLELATFLQDSGTTGGDFIAVAVEPAATAQLSLERQRQLVGLLRNWGYQAAGTGSGTAGGFGQSALVLVQQVRLLQPPGCIGDSAGAVIAKPSDVAMARMGCSTSYNLGLMVADPRDLADGAAVMGPADAERAAFLLRTYRTRDPRLDQQPGPGGYTPSGT